MAKDCNVPQRCFTALSAEQDADFAGNAIRTSKYTVGTFLFLNLWEQFQRLSNKYFLVISILQFIPQVSSMTPTSWIPLVFVLLVNMVKEGIEDARRNAMDNGINSRTVTSVDPSNAALQQLKWKDVCVGSVLILKEDEQLPADVLVLATSDGTGGLCYIETANLDGETNLKNRNGIEETHKFLRSHLSGQDVDSTGFDFLKALTAECEEPNENLNVFHGVLQHTADHWKGKIGLSNQNVIYRGCALKNTAWVCGLVIFCGMETKQMMNAAEKRFKWTALDRLTNKYLIGVFALLAVMCVTSGVLSGVWIAATPSPWYMIDPGQQVTETFRNMITFLILPSAIIPISLSVTMEVVKVGHALFINWDDWMTFTDPHTQVVTSARARTSNLSEDLGQIQYIFSDKTGTLTQNVMEFMKCSIAGERYGSGTTEIGRAACLREGRPLPEDNRPPDLFLEKGNNFWDPKISNLSWKHHPQAKVMDDFFINLAVCHTVTAKPKDGGEPDSPASWRNGNVAYQASSPDEDALVMGAKGSGFWFQRRIMNDVWVVVEGETKPRVYQVLNICEFNSTRKRMSAVVRTPDGRLLLLCKGADSVIFERLRPGCAYQDNTKTHLRDFANEGLRTLCLAQRELSDQEYTEWAASYQEAFTSSDLREERLALCAEQIETQLTLIGATAIEDKLQEGVPHCIATLALANIQLWVLTGDKVETAINIAMACNLLNVDMQLELVSLSDPLPASPGDHEHSLRLRRDERQAATMSKLRGGIANCRQMGQFGLVIDGYALEYALEEEQSTPTPGLLLELTGRCKAVLCCRVSPKQKADVVDLVRLKRGVTTLAIGDGANDVGMILKAHIGVGISGKEGVQAVMSSDYSIAQFRFLQQLILVHGRWDFQRISTSILYFFYKNVVFAVVGCLYGIHSCFSGVNFWDDYYQSVWNVFFTSLPIIFIALFDKDIQLQTTLRRLPMLYSDVQSGSGFSGMRFFWWMVDAIYSSLAIYFLPYFLFRHTVTNPSGQADGKWLYSYIVFANCHMVCNLRLFLIVRTWNALTVGAAVCSILSYWIFSFIFTKFPIGFVKEMYGMFEEGLMHPMAGHSMVLTQLACLLPPLLQLLYSWAINPSLSQQAAIYEAGVIKSIGNARKKSSVLPCEGANLERQMEQHLEKSMGNPSPAISMGRRRTCLMVGYGESTASEFLGYAYSQEQGSSPEVLLSSSSLHTAKRALGKG
eukprot:NODE_33_length_3995_cov_36.399173_g30_i0.p1 GENE.NODE_33_length_3995_cov_36.399173_g30_i0~~NODE_33_length_3995_cov_36.399173_g30_i0.p1  ORF type:complete len:1219 (+),score=320.18 NODE_33_length_3995_cov_36.399173_g30_i0:183-3839(+)